MNESSRDSSHRLLRGDGSCIVVTTQMRPAPSGSPSKPDHDAPLPHEVARSRFDAFEDAFLVAPTAEAIVELRSGLRFVAVNQAFASVLGYTLEQFEERQLRDFVPAAHRAALDATLERLGAGESQRESLTMRLVRADRRERVVDALFVVRERDDGPSHHALVLLEDGGVEESIAGSSRPPGVRGPRNLLQDIIDNVPALVFIKDLEGRYILANRRTLDLYGTCIGQSDPANATLKEAQEFRRHDAVVLAAGEFREFEESTIHAGEPHTYYSLKFPLFDPDGRAYGLGGISTDVTALKCAETAARKAKRDAERANRAKSEFLSTISHELRTPLHSILGYSQLLQMDELPQEVSATVGRIASAGNHLLNLINDLLDLSQIEQGAPGMSIKPVHACDPARAAADMVRPLAAARGLELALDLHQGLHEFVAADGRRLQQVLLNLISNAINYNQPGGEVRVCFRRTGDRRLRFLVSDTGPGINRSDFKRLFLPFERLDEEGRQEGAGLGLAVSKAFVEAMGGSIGIERSQRGRGTTFFVELPLVAPPENAHQLVFGDAWSAEAVTPLAGRILYIEDLPSNIALIEQALKREPDVTLITAVGGDVGLSLASEVVPELILLDLNLPDLPGEKVLAELKRDVRTRSIPVLVLSADATPRRIRRVMAAGADDYLTKPLNLAEFGRAVRAWLGQIAGSG